MDKEYKTMNLEDTANWTEEDFNRAVGEYQRRRNLTSNLTPKKKGKTLKRVILGVVGAGLLAGGIGGIALMGGYENMVHQYLRPNKSYSTPEVRKDYPAITVHTAEEDMLSQSDAIDRVISNVEVFSDVTVGDIVGGSVMEFAENTAPEDVTKEIVKGTVRELSKEVLETGKETVQEVLSDPDVDEAVSGVKDAVSKMGENLQNLLTSP